MQFWKYHALGNDYLVLDGRAAAALTPQQARRLCDRHFGIGGDGILVHQDAPDDSLAAVQIFNPDGSEAEKSGNGLRIFSRYLFDRGFVHAEPFRMWTRGGIVACQALDQGRAVTVDMGRVSFRNRDIPVCGEDREVLNEPISLGNEMLKVSAATVGNPHCVVVCAEPTAAMACRLGPLLETHPLFPQRTNVQFAQVLDRGRIRLEIWERGAGYTLASGSSSCAAAAVLHRLNRCDAQVEVHMPGGVLHLEIARDFSNVRMTGPVVKVAEGTIAPECLQQ
jgi:diaminopimelate epimerase